jgi:ATP-dependent protease ClpP protease subunit
MSEACLIKTTPSTTRKFDVFIRGGIECFEDYDDLVTELAKVTDKDSVTVHLNCPGGDCSVGFFLVDQFMALPCPVEMVVEYPSYSMGAILAVCGDILTIEPDSFIMFHDYSGGSNGKGGETEAYVNNYRKVFRNRFTRLCKPFLSQSEVNRMFKGEDLYIYAGDATGVPLNDRIKRHFK